MLCTWIIKGKKVEENAISKKKGLYMNMIKIEGLRINKEGHNSK